MVLILTAVFLIIATIIRKYFLRNPNFGFIAHLKQQCTIIFIYFSKLWQKKRLNNYVKDLSYPLERTGLISSVQQKELEEPISCEALKETVDEVSMSGFNSKGDSLILRLARKADCRTEIFLFLHLNGKGNFQLPSLPDSRAYCSETGEFSSCGLKVKCLSPMRRWRISYNGILKRLNTNKTNEDVIHVKFSFIWSAISQSYDFQTDFSSSLLSESISREFTLFPYNILNKYKKIFNSYEQWGNYMGTISMNNEEEEELYLWGPRCRNRRVLEWNQIKKYVKVYGYFKDGTMFNLGKINIPGTFKNLKYGYIIKPNRFIHPVESCSFEIATEDGNNSLHKLIFRAAGKSYQVYCRQLNENCEVFYGEKAEIKSTIRLVNYNLETIEGKGYVEFGIRNEFQAMQTLKFRYPCLLLEKVLMPQNVPFVADFNEEICQKETVSGGKGASLALLCKLLNIQKKTSHLDSEDNFILPRGIVITTSAYQHHINSNNLSSKISALQSYKNTKKLEEKCKELSEEFSKTILPDNIKQDILYKLEKVFSDDFQNKPFAIRSSASGEDSLETSAAGQMDTYLGIRSIEQIYKFVIKCWSSQFSNLAVNYKRQMGQRIDSNMAVVVQEMVPAQVAGITFTCDPLTGNPTYITITANYGLGESVVSAASEPDMIILERNLDNTLCIKSQTVGEKRTKIQMSNGEGIISETVKEGEAKLCCLKPEEAFKIGNVAILVEQCFGNPRDIEWAIVNNEIYLLQARPITTQNLETDFEIIHELDAGLLIESEYFSTANVGEVVPNALSPLTISTLHKIVDTSLQLIYHKEEGSSFNAYNPEIMFGLPTIFNHCFMKIIDFVMRKCTKKVSTILYGWQISIFGRVLDNINELHEIAIHRYGIYPRFRQILELVHNIWDSFFVENRLRTASKVVSNNYLPEHMNFISSHQLYAIISQKLPIHSKVFEIHDICSKLSSLYNIIILQILMKEEMNEKLFIDFSKLVSDCENVESMDVPNALKNLSHEIIKLGTRENFIKMNPQEAVKWLEQEKSHLGAKYRKFLQQHGHRGLMEFDLISLTWSMDPAQVVKSLQAMLKGTSKTTTDDRKIKSSDAVIEQLSLGRISKYLLKKLVNWARIGICQREKSKSVLIKSVDVYRKAYKKLGEIMENEGRIPDSNLIYFFTHEEIEILLETRSAHLISKALRRQKLHKSIFDLKFEEIICGIPKPIRETENISKISDWTINGTPICHGIVTGPARVIQKFDEAENIRPGEILVTYSTDVGWTPFFPMLAGIVTELGGLLSHGAVVAREFGIPCIVGARGATTVVKTGDVVMLDGKSGTLKKFEKYA